MGVKVKEIAEPVEDKQKVNEPIRTDWTDAPFGQYVFTSVKIIMKTIYILVGAIMIPTLVRIVVRIVRSFKDFSGVIVL